MPGNQFKHLGDNCIMMTHGLFHSVFMMFCGETIINHRVLQAYLSLT